MEGAYLKLVKDIPKTFHNSDFICGRLFGILRSVRFQKSIGNQKDGWGFSTPLDMKCATTLRQRIKYIKYLTRSFIQTRSRHLGTDK